MNISLDGLLHLAGTDAERFQRLGELARRLNALDRERATILAELTEFGVTEAAAPAAQPSARPLPPPGPTCVMCAEEADQTVDGEWYCDMHATEVVANGRRKPPDG